MIISVPHYRFELGNRKFWIDAHFPAFLTEMFKVSALIRAEVSAKPGGTALETVLSPQEIIELFENLVEEVEKEIKAISVKRAREMGRWSLARMLLIPKGLSRKISADERLAQRERELRISLEILRRVCNSKYLGEIGYLNVTAENFIPADPVYSELVKTDEGFKKRFMEIVQ